jgi:hypothetical protein
MTGCFARDTARLVTPSLESPSNMMCIRPSQRRRSAAFASLFNSDDESDAHTPAAPGVSEASVLSAAAAPAACFGLLGALRASVTPALPGEPGPLLLLLAAAAGTTADFGGDEVEVEVDGRASAMATG